jgi:hypothetical protein
MGVFIDRIRENQLEFGGNYIPTADEWKENNEKWSLAGLAVSLFFREGVYVLLELTGPTKTDISNLGLVKQRL